MISKVSLTYTNSIKKRKLQNLIKNQLVKTYSQNMHFEKSLVYQGFDKLVNVHLKSKLILIVIQLSRIFMVR